MNDHSELSAMKLERVTVPVRGRFRHATPAIAAASPPATTRRSARIGIDALDTASPGRGLGTFGREPPLTGPLLAVQPDSVV